MLTHWAENKAATPVSQSAQFCPNIIIKARNGLEIKHKNESESQSKLPLLSSFKEQTRAFLKVQDGCDGSCSYCIVPETRPVVHSKPADEVLLEAQALVKSGHKEIVLTGVFLGAYGRKSVRRRNWPDHRNDNLADLLDKMAEIPSLARIRLSSLEPADVTQRLLDTLCKHRNIMPHLHLPWQSGSDAVLKRMCRQYEVGEFREKVESIKARLDRPAITTDIIVGFPGETDADFEKTVDLARSVGFAKMHVFGFSPRRGTAAAKMQEAVDNKVTRERSERLRELDVELGLKYRRQFLDETAEVLIENGDGRLCGRSERYFRVYLNQTTHTKVLGSNDLVRVKLLENRGNGMVGAPLS